MGRRQQRYVSGEEMRWQAGQEGGPESATKEVQIKHEGSIHIRQNDQWQYEFPLRGRETHLIIHTCGKVKRHLLGGKTFAVFHHPVILGCSLGYMINDQLKATWRRKTLQFYNLQSITQRCQGRKSRRELEGETMKEHCLVGCLLKLVQLLCLYSSRH